MFIPSAVRPKPHYKIVEGAPGEYIIEDAYDGPQEYFERRALDENATQPTELVTTVVAPKVRKAVTSSPRVTTLRLQDDSTLAIRIAEKALDSRERESQTHLARGAAAALV